MAVLGALGTPAMASAEPQPPPATTTEFQVPARFGTACTLTAWVCLPTLTPVTPSATTSGLGEATFSARVSAPAYACPDVSVRWLNLTTGATGTTALRRTPVDYSRPVAADEWCRYTPATAVTGSGTLTATADTDSVVAPGGFQVQVNPGFGTISVP
ncbi:hypothetical protein AB4Z09_20255 [Rhodococcus sp. TAF43]|uniref:hypothetical protein n=1 Tax=Rhodococcus sp. TAF43 TaxID=3237483 RepID=UPI003F9A64CC